jgi:hypothetical protein
MPEGAEGTQSAGSMGMTRSSPSYSPVNTAGSVA